MSPARGDSPRYRVVLLDAGGTLLGPRDSYGATYARVFEALGLHRSASEFDAAMTAAWRHLGRRIPKGTNRYGAVGGGENAYWLLFVRNVLTFLTPPPSDETLAARALPRLRDAFRTRDAWVVWPDVVPMLTTLRERGVRLGLVSNWDSRLPDLLSRLDLRTRLDSISVSALEGVEKPDPRLFRVALERLGARPEEALHVGDNPELDVAGAASAGVDAVLVDRSGRAGPSPGAMPDLAPLPRLAVLGTAEGVRLRSAPRRS